MSKQDIKEFTLYRTDEFSKADLCCTGCNYVGIINIEKPFSTTWTLYKNPNWDLILSMSSQPKNSEKGKALLLFLELRPEAIKFINDNITHLLCPQCAKNKLCVSISSKYSLKAVARSLVCHKIYR